MLVVNVGNKRSFDMVDSRKLTGTPWHTEKTHGEGIYNSKNCASNVNGICTCKTSLYHKVGCAGKNECEEFGYGAKVSRSKSNIKKTKNKTQRIVSSKRQQENKAIKGYSNEKMKKPNKQLITAGDRVTFEDLQDCEVSSFTISEISTSPFVGKMKGNVIKFKGRKYKILKVVRDGTEL